MLLSQNIALACKSLLQSRNLPWSLVNVHLSRKVKQLYKLEIKMKQLPCIVMVNVKRYQADQHVCVQWTTMCLTTATRRQWPLSCDTDGMIRRELTTCWWFGSTHVLDEHTQEKPGLWSPQWLCVTQSYVPMASWVSQLRAVLQKRIWVSRKESFVVEKKFLLVWGSNLGHCAKVRLMTIFLLWTLLHLAGFHRNDLPIPQLRSRQMVDSPDFDSLDAVG